MRPGSVPGPQGRILLRVLLAQWLFHWHVHLWHCFCCRSWCFPGPLGLLSLLCLWTDALDRCPAHACDQLFSRCPNTNFNSHHPLASTKMKLIPFREGLKQNVSVYPCTEGNLDKISGWYFKFLVVYAISHIWEASYPDCALLGQRRTLWACITKCPVNQQQRRCWGHC
jgi:hypothetical protein